MSDDVSFEHSPPMRSLREVVPMTYDNLLEMNLSHLGSSNTNQIVSQDTSIPSIRDDIPDQLTSSGHPRSESHTAAVASENGRPRSI